MARGLEEKAPRRPRGEPRRPRARARPGTPAGLPRPPDSHRRRASTAMVAGIRQVAALPDPVGETVRGWRRPNGIEITKVRVPLGVIGFIYESRPNVTADAAALCVKSGNACVLARRPRGARVERCDRGDPRQGPREGGAPARGARVHRRARPRGRRGPDHARPVRRPDRPARRRGVRPDGGRARDDPDPQARQGLLPRLPSTPAPTSRWRPTSRVNAKAQRPGVCNAMETLLVHEDARGDVPARGRPRGFRAAGVELRGCPRTRELMPEARPATDADWDTGVSRPRSSSVRVVPSLRRGGRAHPASRLGGGGGDRDAGPPARAPLRGGSGRRLRARSTPRRAWSTAVSSAWARSSGSPRRSSTRVVRSASRSSPRPSSW